MSNYQQLSTHPLTKKIEMATWIDDHYGPHQYGVQFSDGQIFPSDSVKRAIDPDRDQPRMNHATSEYWQDGNTLGTTEDPEQIQLSMEFQLPGEEPFYVLKSKTGWSFDSLEELMVFLDGAIKKMGGSGN